MPAFQYISRSVRHITLASMIIISMTSAWADETEGEYDLNWHTIDCGGGEGQSDQWELEGTIAQVDAGSMEGPPMFNDSGEDETFTLEGGFWPGSAAIRQVCRPDVTHDALVNTNDLLAIINGWGACSQPCPPICAADTNDDCSVNVNDLLAVINAWGPCAP